MTFKLTQKPKAEYRVQLGEGSDHILIIHYDEFTILGQTKSAFKEINKAMAEFEAVETGIDNTLSVEEKAVIISDAVTNLESKISDVYSKLFGKPAYDALVDFYDDNILRLISETKELVLDFTNKAGEYSTEAYKENIAKYTE